MKKNHSTCKKMKSKTHKKSDQKNPIIVTRDECDLDEEYELGPLRKESDLDLDVFRKKYLNTTSS